jgi:quercetin dioxygenase-like cupin family protein
MKHKRLTIVAVVAIVGAIGVGSAVATPGSGVLGAPVLARGTLDGHFKIKLRDSSKSGDVAVQQVILAPGGSTGWHTHLGPAVVIVKSGSFTLYDGDDPSCTGSTYSAGKVFVDQGYGHVHIGRNEGSTNTELYVTYLDVPPSELPRVDAPDPGNCGF